VILPSDHYVADEAVLEDAIRAALRCIGEHRCGVALLGIEPDEPDPELGYILAGPAVAEGQLRSIRRFVEKPPLDEARHLWREGALWNSFIIVCRVASLIELYRSRCTEVVELLERIGSEGVRNCGDRWTERLAQVYQHLRAVDFSQQIAAAQVARLAVMPVAPCGWTDLGTPQRLAKTLARHPRAPVRTCPGPPRVVDVRVNLAERLLATARTGT
jgi:mannose-1-phosphate guanylyltransferase